MRTKKENPSLKVLTLIISNRKEIINMNKKTKKKYKLNYFNIFVFITILISGGILLHDLIVWGILPLYNGKTCCITYFGFFIDMASAFTLEAGIQCLMEK